MAQYNVTANFNVDLSDEIATTHDAAQKFVSDLIAQIACDKNGFYVGVIPRDLHERYMAEREDADRNNPNNYTNE